MRTIFSPDSKFMRGMNRAADLMILNLLFLLTCLPIVTIGPSVTALYSVVFAMGTSREGGTVKPYFRSFRENFGISCRVFLILLAVAAALAADMVLCAKLPGMLSFLTAAFGILAAAELLAAAMIFPWMSAFQNTVMENLKNGLILGIAHLPRAAVVAAMWIFPVVVLIYMPLTFFNAALLWVVIWFSGAAYLSSLLLRRVFAAYGYVVEEEAE